jgi:hypothetical protein
MSQATIRLRAHEWHRFFREVTLRVVVLLATAVTTSVPGRVNGEENTLAECAARSAAFDGIAPLRYATVSAPAGSKVPLHDTFPWDCKLADASKCPAKAYLIGGDDVAIGKTCGAWDYTEFLGANRVSVGWVASDRLMPVLAKPAADPPEGTKRFRAEIQRGKHLPVCRAYLQRLNQTNFRLPPFCGRPENAAVPGFVELTRVWVPIAEINRLQFEVERFIFDQPPDTTLHRTPYPLSSRLASYQFDPPISIQNNGTSRRVVLWNDDSRDEPDCNSTSGPMPLPHRSIQVAIILNADGSALDSQLTISVFGRPSLNRSLPTIRDKEMHNGGYPVIGYTYGVFNYRGTYYFDTFYDYESKTEERTNKLGVFINREKRTEEVCEFLIDQ